MKVAALVCTQTERLNKDINDHRDKNSSREFGVTRTNTRADNWRWNSAFPGTYSKRSIDWNLQSLRKDYIRRVCPAKGYPVRNESYFILRQSNTILWYRSKFHPLPSCPGQLHFLSRTLGEHVARQFRSVWQFLGGGCHFWALLNFARDQWLFLVDSASKMIGFRCDKTGFRRVCSCKSCAGSVHCFPVSRFHHMRPCLMIYIIIICMSIVL